ncbi:Histone-lysine N-methyltransferase SMYD3 [Orchesella cincta]|uniref:Histone-lysine N-methyltransferase SMYD3 n=1 Tax=Orchesella cincta TaxID=48709 RepID=A0A1D2NAE8_ORCCI|nr:Histone-lysine N-methyltransferase SMYD3 [Orchesella cincta]
MSALLGASREESSDENHGHHLSRCSGCHLVRYCDRDCQKKGWFDGHKYECKGFKTHREVAGSFTRILLRIIVKLQNGNDYYDEITHKKIRRRFKDLVSHYSDLKCHARRMEQVEVMGKVVESILKFHPEIKMPNQSELLGICGRIFVNTFSITDHECHTLGAGLYLGASIFDHSCDPMAVANFEGTTIYLRNIKGIPKSMPIEKVTICYKDPLRPSWIRKELLKRHYYFECQCERCTSQLDDKSMCAIVCPNKGCNNEVYLEDKKFQCTKCGHKLDNEFYEKFKEIEEFCSEKAEEIAETAYVDVCDVCMRVMKNVHFSDTHWLMLEMLSGGFDACVELKLWEKAYNYGLLYLVGVKRYMPENWPGRGLSLLRMAKLSWFMEKEAEAKTFIAEAKVILDISHGPNSRFFLQNVVPLIREIALCTEFRRAMNAPR